MFTIRYMKCGRKWRVVVNEGVVNEGFYCIRFQVNKLSLNTSKTNFMVFTNRSCDDTYTVCMNGLNLSRAFVTHKTGASCYRGSLLQGHFMKNYYIDGEIADSSSTLIHQGNH